MVWERASSFRKVSAALRANSLLEVAASRSDVQPPLTPKDQLCDQPRFSQRWEWDGLGGWPPPAAGTAGPEQRAARGSNMGFQKCCLKQLLKLLCLNCPRHWHGRSYTTGLSGEGILQPRCQQSGGHMARVDMVLAKGSPASPTSGSSLQVYQEVIWVTKMGLSCGTSEAEQKAPECRWVDGK